MIAQTGAMLDPSLPFWDIRPNPRFPTIEIRCADIVADVDDAVALAMLVRALVTWALAKVHSGDAGPRVDSECLRAAYWRAARDGWSGGVVHPVSGAIVATGAVLDELVDELLADVLKRHGDAELIDSFRRRLIARGTGADAQRAALSRCNELSGVVDYLIASTAGRT